MPEVVTALLQPSPELANGVVRVVDRLPPLLAHDANAYVSSLHTTSGHNMLTALLIVDMDVNESGCGPHQGWGGLGSYAWRMHKLLAVAATTCTERQVQHVPK